MLVLFLTRVANVNASPDTETLRPNADGHELDYSVYPADTIHYVAVDDVTPDADSTYVYVTPQNKEDYWGLQDSTRTGTINSVTVWLRVKHDTGAEKFKICIYTYGTEFKSADIVDTTTWTDYSETWTTNPYTVSAWTWTEIDDLEIGIMSINVGGWSGEQRVTQAWIVVDYTEAPPSVPEFPLGLEAAMALGLGAFVIYVLWKGRPKNYPAT